MPVKQHSTREEGQPVVNIVGDKIVLGPLRRDLVPTYLTWVSDFEVTRTLGVALRPMTLEAEHDWYDRLANSDRDVPFT